MGFEKRLQRRAEAEINGRAFFVPESGSMGLCPPGAVPGDEVWVVFGSLVPFILQPRKDDGGRSTTSSYCFISDYYLQGIMDGEAIISEEESSNGHSVIVTLCQIFVSRVEWCFLLLLYYLKTLFTAVGYSEENKQCVRQSVRLYRAGDFTSIIVCPGTLASVFGWI